MPMTDPATIRRATADDGPACAGVVFDWVAATPWVSRRFTRAEFDAMLTEGLPKREAWVIGDPVVGYISLDPGEQHIWGLYVAERGRGYGRSLIEKVKEHRNRLQLNTHLPNTRAHAFYAREGFVQVGQPWDGDDGVPEIRMEWHR